MSLEAHGVLLRLYLIAGQCSGAGDRVPLPRSVAFAAAAKVVVGEEGVAPLGALVEAGLVVYERESDALRLVILDRHPPRRTAAREPDNVVGDRARADTAPADTAPADTAPADERVIAKKLSGLFSKYGLRDPEARLRWFEGAHGRHTIARLRLSAEQVQTYARSAGCRGGRFGFERDARSARAPIRSTRHVSADTAPTAAEHTPPVMAPTAGPNRETAMSLPVPTTAPTVTPTAPTVPTTATTAPLAHASAESSAASNNRTRSAAAADERGPTHDADHDANRGATLNDANHGATPNDAERDRAERHNAERDSAEHNRAERDGPKVDGSTPRSPARADCVALTRALCERLRPNELITDGGGDVREGIGRCVLDAAARDARLSSPAGLDAIADAIRHPARTWPNWNVIARRQRRVSLTLLAGVPDASGERPYTVLFEVLAAAADALAKRDPARSEPASSCSPATRPGPVASKDFFRQHHPLQQKVVNDV
ncbi:MAG: hypothetical protein U0326_39325 [Polyangiales bacterium]